MFDRRIPVATYRVQLNRQLRFEDARKLVPYLHRLGISDLYASPVLKARRGSTHGYDVVDPSRLNPELGNEADFDALSRELKEHGMGLLLDIVPNHMAANPENPWWSDILENGRCSPYAAFFDIDWAAADNKVLLTVLDCPYRQALESGQFSLILDGAGLFVRYQDYELPLDVRSYRLVLDHRLDALGTALGSSRSDLEQVFRLINTLEHLTPCFTPDPQEASRIYRERREAKETFRLVSRAPQVKAWLLGNIALFNGRRGRPKSFELMNNLLEEQAYRLGFWQTAREQLNYRRFFDISDLVGLRVEEADVFQASHALILSLVREDKVTGLRIDHIDGLRDPGQYLSRLQRHIASEVGEAGGLRRFYVVVEKILSRNEDLPPDWPVSGTTGYDFTNTLNALFVDSKGANALDEIYRRFTGSTAAFSDVVYEKKKQVIAELFPGEIRALGRHLAALARREEGTDELSIEELAKAIGELTACLPVYRTYTRTFQVSPRDNGYLEQALSGVKGRPNINITALDFLQRILTLDFPHRITTEHKETWLGFVLRWQQLTGAIMAKGFEDTALYGYSRLLSLNEVGGAPGARGLSVDDFHRLNLARLERWPHTMNATSTHDTKRSQDVRARINVLSEIPEEWEAHLSQWRKWNAPKKTKVNEALVPEPDIEMLVYQTLIGAWPLYEEEVPEFRERLKAYLVKAVREAKVYSNWLSPSLDYESALVMFLESILEDFKGNKFLRGWLPFTRKIAYYGMLNSLAQVLLKVTCPGVPDFYQGTELWDFSLVDPDNRRPVDFEKRVKLLNELIGKEASGLTALVRELQDSWRDGRLKMYTTYKILGFRRDNSTLFRDGDYLPLEIKGQIGEVCAFARRLKKNWALVLAPRFFSKLDCARSLPLDSRVWGDDLLLLPDGAPENWRNVFTGESLKVSTAGKRVLPLSDVLGIFPVALLVND
ncbi:MAG: malto-oligosyltrehalose synthase [Dehalococcoidales bacterium]|nr:malto-oligosyltrehalose synthase [Dehalococcoidales bacterium]